MYKLQPELGQKPDRWVLTHVVKDGKDYISVLSGWSGGYLHGDEWRWSTPLVEFEDQEDAFVVRTRSGSTYNLRKAATGFTSIMLGVSERMTKDMSEADATVRFISDLPGVAEALKLV